jgi:ribose 5-phosphate isomerase RpiB
MSAIQTITNLRSIHQMKKNTRSALLTIPALSLLTGICLCVLFACQSKPKFTADEIRAWSDAHPPASILLAPTVGHIADAGKKVSETASHLQAAQDAHTLPVVKSEVSKAQVSNAAAAVAVHGATQGIAAATPAAKAQEVAAAKCEVKLEAAQSYDWLKTPIKALTIAVGALEVFLGVVYLFPAIADSTILSAIPVVSSVINFSKKFLLTLMAYGAGIIFVGAWLGTGTHLATSIDVAMVVLAIALLVFFINMAIAHHIGDFFMAADAELAPAGLKVEHWLATAWAWFVFRVHAVIAHFLPKKAATLPNAQAPAAPLPQPPKILG